MSRENDDNKNTKANVDKENLAKAKSKKTLSEQVNEELEKRRRKEAEEKAQPVKEKNVANVSKVVNLDAKENEIKKSLNDDIKNNSKENQKPIVAATSVSTNGAKIHLIEPNAKAKVNDSANPSVKDKTNDIKDSKDTKGEAAQEKREKVKLDELIKKAKDEETKKVKKDDVIINLDFKNQKNIKAKDKTKAEEKEEKENKKKLEKNLKVLGGAKDLDDENLDKKKKTKDSNKRDSKKLDEDVKAEINLDVLGVPRAKEEIDIGSKIAKFMAIIFILCILVVVCLTLPFFDVQEVNVTGLTILEKEDVEKQIGYDENKNFFYLYFSNMQEKVLAIPQVKEATVRFTFPNAIDIKINEIRLSGYIPYVTEYVYIDSDGRVVEISNSKIEGVPLIEGLDFDHFALGSVLETSNEESLKTIIEITNVLNKYDLSSVISSIDVTTADDVRLLVRQIEVSIGTIEECDHKIRMAMEAIDKLADNAKGYLDVSNTSGRIYFKPLS